MKRVLRLPWAAPRRIGEIEMRNTLLAAIVASSNDAISSFTPDGIITSWNPAAERIFGYSADEMIGQSYLVFVPSEKADDVADLEEKLRKGQSIANYETVRLRKDGSAVPVSMNISPIYDLTGAINGGSAICRDMTELKKFEKQNALLTAIVTTSNDAIVSYTLDGILTSWNPAAERMYDYSADEMIGQPFSVHVPSEKADDVANILGKIRKGQPILNYETERLRKDGSAVPVSINISPIYDLTGAINGASSIARDMTELKKSEKQNALLAAIVEHSNDAIMSDSLDGIITSWNPAAERMYGYTADEMIGQPFSILIPSEKADDVANILGKIRDGHLVEHFETVRIRKDGSAFPVSVTISPIHDSTGALVGASVITRDMTELKTSEKQNALLVAIVTTSNDAILSESLDGIITSWNPAAERLYGYTADEIVGQPFSVLVPSEKADDVANILGKIRKGQPILNYETERLRKDGSAVPVSINISPIYDLVSNF